MADEQRVDYVCGGLGGRQYFIKAWDWRKIWCPSSRTPVQPEEAACGAKEEGCRSAASAGIDRVTITAGSLAKQP